MAYDNLPPNLGLKAAANPQYKGTKPYRVTMNGTTNVTITLEVGVYRVRLMSADPAIFAYGSFGGAPTLPASGSGTVDIQIFPSGGLVEFLFVNDDVTYNVKLSAAGTPELMLVRVG